MITHSILHLPRFGTSFALLSLRKAKDTAIFFCHGFGGDPQGTWIDFTSLVGRDLRYSKSDLFFFDYSNQSIAGNLAANAARFLEFIQNVFPVPTPILLENAVIGLESYVKLHLDPPMLLPKKYSRVILVGHSEGGLLIRILVWEMYKKTCLKLFGMLPNGSARDAEIIDETPLLASQPCLFAPAHIGISFSGLSRVLGKLLFLNQMLSGVSPSYRQMSSQHSQILKDVRLYTEQANAKHPSVRALTGRVLWGGKENVVEPWQFKLDSPVEHEFEKDHFSVCKPTTSYLRPLEFVINAQSKKRKKAAN